VTAARFSRVYGLGLESNRPLAGLIWHPTPVPVDVRIQFGHWPREIRERTTPALPPSHVSPFADAAGVPLARGWDLPDGSRHIVADSGAEAVIDGAGHCLWVSSPAPGEDLDAWVLGPLLSLLLRRRAIACLHASAVLIGGGVVAFAGWQGAGKSTLATLCAMRGCPVVTDDLAALDVPALPGAKRVHPGGAFLRTRPGIVEVAAGRLSRARDLKAAPAGEWLNLDARQPPYAIASKSEPLRALYFLDRRQASRAATESAEPLRSSEAMMVLAGDTWAARWLSPSERAAEVKVLTRLVKDVPTWRVRRPTGVESWLACADQIVKRQTASNG
jgi:hypothetical protein